MTSSIRLGRLFGIEIGFNWSLLFLFALITWTLAATVLPQDVPDQSSLAYWATAVVGALAFYACLLMHELAHAVVATRKGVKVSGITFWLFGGVSKLEGEPSTAGDEALLTVVGPLTSFGLAVLAAVLALGLSATGAPALLTDLLTWLAFLNAGLGLFNLVPAFPLDGGRLLAAFFWWRTGSRPRGVHRAVQVGRIVAFLMIGLGVAELFLNDVLGGVWIAFIGWFLLAAASAEESATRARVLLKSVPVSAAMSAPVVTVPDWLTVEDFLTSVAARHPFTTYPLYEPSGTLTGVARLGDVVRTASSGGQQKRLRDAARPVAEIPTARPDEDLETLLERLGPALDRRVLVFDGPQLVGILSPADVARLVILRRALQPTTER